MMLEPKWLRFYHVLSIYSSFAFFSNCFRPFHYDQTSVCAGLTQNSSFSLQTSLKLFQEKWQHVKTYMLFTNSIQKGLPDPPLKPHTGPPADTKRDTRPPLESCLLKCYVSWFVFRTCVPYKMVMGLKPHPLSTKWPLCKELKASHLVKEISTRIMKLCDYIYIYNKKWNTHHLPTCQDWLQHLGMPQYPDQPSRIVLLGGIGS